MRREVKPDQLNDWAHQPYRAWLTGDGTTKEFPVQRSVLRLDNLRVTVDGQPLRPHEGATQYDFGVRGLSQGYEGSKDRIQLAVPPAHGAQIVIEVDG